MKTTSENITKLNKNEIFVFGSNLAGIHGAGAALLAANKFGAEAGVGVGLTGKCYALPTKNVNIETMPLVDICNYIADLRECVVNNPDKQFLITAVGCGLAGYTAKEIAPMFKLFLNLPNLYLPKSFLDILIPVIKGYKVTDAEMACRGFKFELGKEYTQKGEIVACNNGFHFCEELKDCFGYYDFDPNNRVFEVEGYGETDVDGNKHCVEKIKFIKEISWLEVLEMVNLGKGNTGIGNAGNRNAGNDNAGDYNAGNRNAGYSNAGYSNAGNSNAGYRNAGDYNAGNSNAGDYNAGNRNAGYSNAGNDNAGAFNNLEKPNYVMFNKPSSWSYEDFVNSNAYGYLQSVDTTLWIPEYKMTEEEKKQHPYFDTTGGYVKHLPYKEAFTNSWNNWSDTVRSYFTSLPNFDAEIFEDITGVKV